MNSVPKQLGSVILLVMALGGANAVGQTSPYRLFSDAPYSASMCEVVNAAQVELAVLDATGELEVLSGDLVPLGFVDNTGYVTIGFVPTGRIMFADDAQGLPALFWLSANGTIYDWDERFQIARETQLYPSNRSGTACDVCEVITDPAICGGCLADVECDDFDPCTDDICEAGDCFHYDNEAFCDDGDPCTENDFCFAGVCAGTEIEGCVVVIDDGPTGPTIGGAPRVSFSFCGSGASLAMCLTAFGLVNLSLFRRRF